MRKRRQTEFLSPELTPLIDIVFILLIFFMVSSVFKKKEHQLKINLPKSQAGQPLDTKKNLLKIFIHKDFYQLDEKKFLKTEELKQQISSFSKEAFVQVKADGESSYQRVVEVLDMIKSSGLKNISLITKKTR